MDIAKWLQYSKKDLYSWKCVRRIYKTWFELLEQDWLASFYHKKIQAIAFKINKAKKITKNYLHKNK